MYEFAFNSSTLHRSPSAINSQKELNIDECLKYKQDIHNLNNETERNICFSTYSKSLKEDGSAGKSSYCTEIRTWSNSQHPRKKAGCGYVPS
jgi:UDP-N-acetylglucosamine pyrophosphorylase